MVPTADNTISIEDHAQQIADLNAYYQAKHEELLVAAYNKQRDAIEKIYFDYEERLKKARGQLKITQGELDAAWARLDRAGLRAPDKMLAKSGIEPTEQHLQALRTRGVGLLLGDSSRRSSLRGTPKKDPLNAGQGTASSSRSASSLPPLPPFAATMGATNTEHTTDEYIMVPNLTTEEGTSSDQQKQSHHFGFTSPKRLTQQPIDTTHLAPPPDRRPSAGHVSVPQDEDESNVSMPVISEAHGDV
eukprot:GDKJ01026053.1.p1 GENE.GDKJ01026053.1~~GDKJ01026053.1.p1  ORF type:complete len:246 (-),score=20.22 GDKJ01026053.1:88-825(-)